ncbi:MAG TPA: hypothetical protein VLJ37_05965 [bacterium]|nr:hypothetical protein [bacterium]
MRMCYCHIPPDRLVQIVREKFIEKVSTVRLLEQCTNDIEKGYVNTIALLDVPEPEIYKMFQGEKDFLAHFFDCRQHALQVLKGKIPDLGKHLRLAGCS